MSESFEQWNRCQSGATGITSGERQPFVLRDQNHSAYAGRQGFGGGAYQQAFAEVINSALLAATVFLPGQCYTLDKSLFCDPFFRSIIFTHLIRPNQGQCFPCATFSSVPASRIHRKCRASRFSIQSILPLIWLLL